MIHYILSDLLEPISYLYIGLAVGLLYLLLHGILLKIGGRTVRWDVISLRAIFLVYLTVLLIQTFFSREPGSRDTVDLTLFGTWGTTLQAHAYVVENVLLFLPYGCLLPLIGRWRGRAAVIGTGVICSVVLELAQFLTKRGHCQLDDVVMNGLGCAIGYAAYRVFKAGFSAGFSKREKACYSHTDSL